MQMTAALKPDTSELYWSSTHMAVRLTILTQQSKAYLHSSCTWNSSAVCTFQQALWSALVSNIDNEPHALLPRQAQQQLFKFQQKFNQAWQTKKHKSHTQYMH